MVVLRFLENIIVMSLDFEASLLNLSCFLLDLLFLGDLLLDPVFLL
jgi:hypothetical protein